MPPSAAPKNVPKSSQSKQRRKQPRLPGKSGMKHDSNASRTIATDRAVYFFRPKEEHGYLSQWYISPFTNGVHSYENAEQYMMHQKGVLFAPDSPATSSILETTNPRDIRALGRMIPNFDEAIWKRERLRIVTEGSRLKFKQNEILKTQLLATGDNELVEASPFDRIWGVGFSAKSAPMKRAKWGENLLGKALMAVRQELKEESGDELKGEPTPRRDLLGSQLSNSSNQTSLRGQPDLPGHVVLPLPSPAQANVILSLPLL